MIHRETEAESDIEIG